MKRIVLAVALLLLAADARAQVVTVSSLGPSAPVSTVANLPACNAATQGALYLVTDALLPAALANVAGGGAVKVLVVCNGANYIVS